jgi:ubiquinone/menaquinone biosynthesis C-methylase UbiE
LWAPFYGPSVQNPLMSAEAGAMRRAIDRAPRGRALDVGTGCGRWLATLAGRAPSVVGLDVSREMLARAPGEFLRVQAAAEQLPFPDASFDFVVSSLTIGHVPDLTAWTREVARVLRPGGMLVYSDLHPSCEHAHPARWPHVRRPASLAARAATSRCARERRVRGAEH